MLTATEALAGATVSTWASVSARVDTFPLPLEHREFFQRFSPE